MSQTPTPNPVNRKALSRASVAGAILGVVAIVLFVVLWLVLGQFGLSQFPRLILSLCLPPTLLVALLGVYLIVLNNRSRP